MAEAILLCYCSGGNELLTIQFRLERDEIPYQVRKSGVENLSLTPRFFADSEDPGKNIQVWVPENFLELAQAAITGESSVAEIPKICPACGADNSQVLEECAACGLYLG